MVMKKDDFRARDGWLDKLKKQFGIRFLTIMGDKLSCDISAVDPFVRKFQEQVYNTDEYGLFQRLLPTKTIVHRAEESAARRKMSIDRIMFMPCSNASGIHKLEMLVFGKAANLRTFENQTLPVIYKRQSHGCITREVFTEWFYESFEPSVKTFLKKQNFPLVAVNYRARRIGK
jgi:hypothetical protein